MKTHAVKPRMTKIQKELPRDDIFHISRKWEASRIMATDVAC